MNFRPVSDTRHLWDTWFYDHDGEFYLFYLSNPAGRDGTWLPWDAFSLATSHDLINWVERGEVFSKSDNPADWDSEIITTGDIIKHKSRFYMSYRATTNSVEKNNIIVSDDLLNWERISADPVLETEAPYEHNPVDTVNNYVEMRDVTMTELPNGDVEGIFTARIDAGPHTGRGVLGRAITKDFIHWRYADPIFAPGVFNVIEVPSRYERDGRNYLLFCVNSHLESQLDSPSYPNMQFCTGYVFSDSVDGPFEYVQDQVLGIGDAYVGRIVDAGGETLFLHHLVSKRPAFCLPKAVVFNDDGSIELRYWQGVDALASGEPMTSLKSISPGTGNGFPVCDVILSGDDCTLENVGGFGDAYLDGEYADYVLDITINAQHCHAAGVVLNAADRSGVLFTFSDGEIFVGTSRSVYGHLAPSQTRHIYRHASLDSGRIELRVVSRSEGFDWYIGGRHVLTTVDEISLSGQIGFFVRRGRARFTGFRLQPLVRERSK